MNPQTKEARIALSIRDQTTREVLGEILEANDITYVSGEHPADLEHETNTIQVIDARTMEGDNFQKIRAQLARAPTILILPASADPTQAHRLLERGKPESTLISPFRWQELADQIETLLTEAIGRSN